MAGNFFAAPPDDGPDRADIPDPASGPSTPERFVTPALYRFFEARGISAHVVNSAKVSLTQREFPAGKGKAAAKLPAITVPFHRKDGQVVNHMYRPPAGVPVLYDDPAIPTAWGIEHVETPDVVWIVGDLLDAMALQEVDYWQTIAIYDQGGARETPFPALAEHAELLATVKQFVLAGPLGAKGTVWREALAARLGRHRCLVVQWPTEAPSASDVLVVDDGHERLRAALEGAAPYPIEGLLAFNGDTLVEYRGRPPPKVMRTGLPETDASGLRIPAEGRLIVVTGIPSSGKSVYLRFLMLHLMRDYNRRFAVYSPEMEPWQEYLLECVRVLSGKQFWGVDASNNDAVITDLELRERGKWLGQRLKMIGNTSAGGRPTLGWLLERAEMSVLRDGSTDVVLDPWSGISHDFGGKNEATYVNDRLVECLDFRAKYGVNIWVVAHPKVQVPIKVGGKLMPPNGYDIAGGAMWFNHTELGLTVHRDDDNSRIHIWKSKRRRWGDRGQYATVKYDVTTGRYLSPPRGLFGQNYTEPGGE